MKPKNETHINIVPAFANMPKLVLVIMGGNPHHELASLQTQRLAAVSSAYRLITGLI